MQLLQITTDDTTIRVPVTEENALLLEAAMQEYDGEDEGMASFIREGYAGEYQEYPTGEEPPYRLQGPPSAVVERIRDDYRFWSLLEANNL